MKCVYAWVFSSEGIPGALVVENLLANAGGLIPGSRSHEGGHGNPLQHSRLGESHGQRSLAGCGPQGCKESDTAELT